MAENARRLPTYGCSLLTSEDYIFQEDERKTMKLFYGKFAVVI